MVEPIPENTQLALLTYYTNKAVAEKVKESYQDIFPFKLYAIRRCDKRINVLGSDGDGYRCYMQENDASNGELVIRDKFRNAFVPNWKNPTEIGFMFLGTVLTAGIFPLYSLLPPVIKRRRKTREFDAKEKMILEANTKDLEKLAASVKVYQTSMRELSEELGIPIERVETGNEISCLRTTNTAYGGRDNSLLWLRAEAGMLGADALVHYTPGSAIATPVRFKGKK